MDENETDNWDKVMSKIKSAKVSDVCVCMCECVCVCVCVCVWEREYCEHL